MQDILIWLITQEDIFELGIKSGWSGVLVLVLVKVMRCNSAGTWEGLAT